MKLEEGKTGRVEKGVREMNYTKEGKHKMKQNKKQNKWERECIKM